MSVNDRKCCVIDGKERGVLGLIRSQYAHFS